MRNLSACPGSTAFCGTAEEPLLHHASVCAQLDGPSRSVERLALLSGATARETRLDVITLTTACVYVPHDAPVRDASSGRGIRTVQVRFRRGAPPAAASGSSAFGRGT